MTSPSSEFVLPLVTLGDSIAPDELSALTKACSEHGFFLLNNVKPDGSHHIEPALLTRMWAIAAEVFDVPDDAKARLSVSKSDNNRGYFSSIEHAEFNKDPSGVKITDTKEGIFFGSSTLIAPGNVVAETKAHLLPEVEGYMDKARATCVTVMKAIVRTGQLSHLEEQDPDAFCARYLSDPVYMMKMLKYPASNGCTDAHTDYGCITLLLPGDKGLQVWYKDQWHEVPVVPNAFVINFGDLLQMWSGGRIRSTIHRVIFNSPTGTPRYSIPFFLHPQRGSAINCGADKGIVDSYEYVLDRFDKTYRHRAAAAAATTPTPTAVSA